MLINFYPRLGYLRIRFLVFQQLNVTKLEVNITINNTICIFIILTVKNSEKLKVYVKFNFYNNQEKRCTTFGICLQNKNRFILVFVF